jgi:hypothetical protein
MRRMVYSASSLLRTTARRRADRRHWNIESVAPDWQPWAQSIGCISASLEFSYAPKTESGVARATWGGCDEIAESHCAAMCFEPFEFIVRSTGRSEMSCAARSLETGACARQDHSQRQTRGGTEEWFRSCSVDPALVLVSCRLAIQRSGRHKRG